MLTSEQERQLRTGANTLVLICAAQVIGLLVFTVVAVVIAPVGSDALVASRDSLRWAGAGLALAALAAGIVAGRVAGARAIAQATREERSARLDRIASAERMRVLVGTALGEMLALIGITLYLVVADPFALAAGWLAFAIVLALQGPWPGRLRRRVEAGLSACGA